jgi:hypothetical protein
VVFTDIADSTSAELMLENVGRLLRQHLVLFVMMRDEELEDDRAQGAREPPMTSRAPWSPPRLLRERDVVVTRLRRMGVEIVEARRRPGRAGPAGELSGPQAPGPALMAELHLKSYRFRAEREDDWRRLEKLLTKVGKGSAKALSDEELLALPVLYRQALSSLSVARATSLDQGLVDYLESLSTRPISWSTARDRTSSSGWAASSAMPGPTRPGRCGARPWPVSC